MTPWLEDTDLTVWCGDALDVLRGMADGSVDCVVTSPPYWGLRDYGTGEWEGGNPDCDHKPEPKPMRKFTNGRGEGAERRNVCMVCDYEGPVTSDETERCPKCGSKMADTGYAGSNLTSWTYRDATVKDGGCPKGCGARRVDRQLGLEPTPDAYVQNMVNVFREVRRVLAPHGTCWVNLGDSYVANGRYDEKYEAQHPSRGAISAVDHQKHGGTGRKGFRGGGLKPKDLVGVPWRVAFALQQPYYTGRIKDEHDRIWLAAMVDTEGCIHIHKRAAGAKSHTHTLVNGETVDYERKTDTYGVMVSIDNTSEALIDRIHALVGQGSRYTHEKGVGKSNRKQTLYRITLTGQQSRELLRELYPHLVAKQREARIAYHSPSSGDGAEAAWVAIKALHNGEDTAVDYPAPPTLFEPGWYLRSDVIWGKPNPMPESVTDRPTKSHEYVFLLTKGPRYWFDQEAVREGFAADPENGGGWSQRYRDEQRKVHNGGDNVGRTYNPAGRNVRSVWEIATQPYPEAHFATFPEELARRCIVAGCPAEVCGVCGKPRERIVEETAEYTAWKQRESGWAKRSGDLEQGRGTAGSGTNSATVPAKATTVGWSDCGHQQYRPGVVLDPFGGSGTVAHVARKHGRRAVLIELNEAYCQLIARRTAQQSLLAGGAA